VARKFFYVSLGILALSIAYQLGAGSVRADFDDSTNSPIVGMHGDNVLDRNGEVWSLFSLSWDRRPTQDPPVPISEIRFWQVNQLITHDDVAWAWSGYPDFEWVNIGPYPGTVSVEAESFGSTKGRFR